MYIIPRLIICLLVLDLVDQSTDVREQLNSKLITDLDKLLGVLGCANTRRSTGQDDSTSGQSGALGKEADQLRNTEDQVTRNDVQFLLLGIKKIVVVGTYVRGQSCITRPLLRPRICSLLTSGMRAAEARTGPADVWSVRYS